MARLPVRQILIAGNWKMNLHHLEAIGLVQKLAFALPAKYYDRVEVAVLPPFTDLRSVQTLVAGDKLLVRYGAQDLSPKDSGAFTGDVSGPMLAKLGCSYVVVGHSERREHHGEDDALVCSKVRAAFKHGITPILCVGEGLEVREAGTHVEHCTGQLRAALSGVGVDAAASLVLAYEPVWAIGTGDAASPDDAQAVAAQIRSILRETDPDGADEVPIQYGGSVTDDNAADFCAQPDVDGALVGGASLKPDAFAAILRAAEAATRSRA